MSNPYEELYEKRRNYDPFSSREAIDCKTALEDIFGAFLGEAICIITQNYAGWERIFIYQRDIDVYRNCGYKDYSPHMILTTQALDGLLGTPLRQLDYPTQDANAANRIQETFLGVRIGLDGLVKIFNNLLHARDNNLTRFAPGHFTTVKQMSDAIHSVRNPSAHRNIDPSDVPMAAIWQNAGTALRQIRQTLPVMEHVFISFTATDAQTLENRYVPLLTRVLDGLDKKLNGTDLAQSGNSVTYRDLSGYSIFLDESALATGHSATLSKLTDELQVYIYEDSLASVAKTTTNQDALTKFVAKNAMSAFYMSRRNIVLLKNRKETDRQSILETLRNNPDKKFFVVTQSHSFAGQILALGNPRHIAARTRNDKGEFIIYRSENSNE